MEIFKIWNSEIFYIILKNLRREKLKLAKLRREKVSRLKVKPNEVEQNLGNDEAKEQYNACRAEINEIYDEISNSIKIKSKCDW